MNAKGRRKADLSAEITRPINHLFCKEMIPMKHALAIVAAAISIAQAEPVISNLEWRPACEGAIIEVISDHGKILSVHASAFHSAVIAEWSVHYADGVPVSAEYRELKRGRILEGDRAGDYSGENTVNEISTWTWDGDHFPIEDKSRREELKDILQTSQKEAEKTGSKAKSKGD